MIMSIIVPFILFHFHIGIKFFNMEMVDGDLAMLYVQSMYFDFSIR